MNKGRCNVSKGVDAFQSNLYKVTLLTWSLWLHFEIGNDGGSTASILKEPRGNWGSPGCSEFKCPQFHLWTWSCFQCFQTSWWWVLWGLQSSQGWGGWDVKYAPCQYPHFCYTANLSGTQSTQDITNITEHNNLEHSIITKVMFFVKNSNRTVFWRTKVKVPLHTAPSCIEIYW